MRHLGASSPNRAAGSGDALDPAGDDRAPLLFIVLALFVALATLNIFVIALQPGASSAELLLFAATGVGFLCIAVALRRGWLSYAPAASTTLALLGMLIIERILSLFLGDYLADPARSLFMPVFAYLPLLYLMCFVLLRPARALTAALGLWLAISALVTVLSLPFWNETPLRSSLPATLSFLWLGHAIFVAVFAATARHQRQLTARLDLQAAAQQRLLDEVRASEAGFRSVFDLAAVGINVTDAAGRYVMVNQRMVDMLGYTREELLRMNFRDVTAPDDLAPVVRLSDQVSERTLERFRVEKRYLSKGGRIVHAEIFVRELEGQTDGQRRFICVALDITERKRAEAAATEHRRIRDFHFDHTPLGVVEFGRDMRIRRWSKRAEKMFGWTEAEVLGRSAEEIGVIPPDQALARAERVRKMLEGGQDHLSAVVPMVHRSGRRLWIEVHNSITRDAQGQPSTLISMSLDVTESQDMLRMLNESEARFRGIFNQAAVGIAVLDAEGRWLNVNQKLCEITGYPLEELLEISFQSITHPDDLERDLHMARAAMDRTIDQYSIEKRYIRKGGAEIWVQLFVRRLEATAETPARFVSVVEDISERKAAEQRVRALTVSLESQVAERTAQLRDIVRAGQRRNEELTLVNEMGRLLSAANDRDEAAQVVVRYLPRIFPLADGALHLNREAGGMFERRARWGESPLGSETLNPGDCWALRRCETHHVEGEVDALHCAHVGESCRRHPHLCVPILALGAPLGLIELAWGRSAEGWAPEMPLVRTVAEKIGLSFGNLKLREELSRQALLDPLTGLNNRRWLENALRLRVARHARGGEGFAVLMVDVDHFKSINDGYGHEAGDRALQEIARVLARAVRDGEAAARFGGEEFTVVLDTLQPGDALAVAERIRQSVTAVRVDLREGQLPPLTVSVGIAFYPNDGADIDAVVARADAALYDAKRGGRNQVCLPAPASTPAREPISVTH